MARLAGAGWGILSITLWATATATAAAAAPVPRAGGKQSAAQVGAAAPASTAAAPRPVLDGTVDPRTFGTQDQTITVVSAVQFRSTCIPSLDVGSFSLYCCADIDFCDNGAHYYAPILLPAGAVIDSIGVNTATTVYGAMGFTLHFRDHLGGSAQLVSFALPDHPGFATDYSGPLGILVPNNVDREFVLDVETSPGLEENQYFGYVEVWWHRVVSDAPEVPQFGDVPASHPFYQFIEALAASGITAGCGPGIYCPDAPLTRGQMAAFLSKALGLHWPE